MSNGPPELKKEWRWLEGGVVRAPGLLGGNAGSGSVLRRRDWASEDRR